MKSLESVSAKSDANIFACWKIEHWKIAELKACEEPARERPVVSTVVACGAHAKLDWVTSSESDSDSSDSHESDSSAGHELN